jgi:hypothetical protein
MPEDRLIMRQPFNASGSVQELRSRAARNPNPMTFGRGFAYRLSEQFVDYLQPRGSPPTARVKVKGEIVYTWQTREGSWDVC